MAGRIRFVLRLVAALVLAFGLGAPANAQIPIKTCITPLSGSTTAGGRTDPAPPRTVCTAGQTVLGGGDFAARLHFAPVWNNPADPLVLRYSSVWQDHATLLFHYADGSVARVAYSSADTSPFMTIGAIIQVTVPLRAAPLTGITAEIRNSANFRGVFIDAKLMPRSEAFRFEGWLIALYAGFAGLALALIAYNLSLWVVLRHHFQLIYCTMVGAMGLYAMTSSGAAGMLLPGLDNNDRMRLNYLLLAACTIAATGFMRAFFGKRVFGPRLRAYALGAVINLILSTAAFVVLMPRHAQIVAGIYMAAQALLLVTVIPIVHQAWRTDNRYLRLFVLAWSAPVIVSFLRIASGFHLIGYSFWLDNSNIIALAFECFISTLLIVSRVRELSHDRDTARAGEQSALRLANSDPLTGLLNRRAFMGIAVGRPGRFKLMLIDIDRFKEINDRLGHDTGDDVLRELGEILQSLRPQGSLAVRLGGEEFALLVPLAGEVQCQPSRILEAVREHPMPHGVKVTVSIGVAMGQVATDKAWRSLYRLADSALYRAKADGRDRACRATDFAQIAAA